MEAAKNPTRDLSKNLMNFSADFSRPELLGDEAESMTDQEIALIRRHAGTMACILVEMYQEGCRISE